MDDGHNYEVAIPRGETYAFGPVGRDSDIHIPTAIGETGAWFPIKRGQVAILSVSEDGVATCTRVTLPPGNKPGGELTFERVETRNPR